MEVYNESPMASVLLKDEGSPSVILDSALWVSNSSSFHASASMVNLEDEINRDMPFFSKIESKMETFYDGYDNCYHQLGRKRRLTADQVHFLEKSFELENKLEPERKIQLAKELCLQPRQVAIWFQNRRARYKTKVLEKEYDKLKASYDQLKADYKNLCKEKEIMENEVDLLTDELFMRRNKRAKPEPISPTESPSKHPKFSPNAVTYAELASSCKHEDASSSDVLDSENPKCNHSLATVEPANSSDNFGPEASDFSQDEDEEGLGRSLLTTSVFPKTEDELYDDLQPNSCNLGFPVLNQGTWFWQ